MKSGNFLNFIRKARSVHGYKYEYLEYINMKTPIKISLCGIIFFQNPSKHLMGRSPEKGIQKMTNDEFIFKSKEIWNNRFDYRKTLYNGSLKSIIIIDIESGIEYTQRANSHLNGVDPFIKMTTEDFISRSVKKHGDIYDYSLTIYKNYHKKVKIIYKNTGEVFDQTPSNHLSGLRPDFAKKMDNISFIRSSNNVHDFKYNYDKVIYLNSKSKVIIICKFHGDFNQTPNSHLQGSGCPSCNESSGEREIDKFLKKYKITYDRQHKFSDCRNMFELPFDFYISSIRTCIEFDGIQHFQPVEYFGGVDAYNKLKINDKIKNDYCEDNYINLIRIRYDQIDDIWDVLWSHLGPSIRRLKLG